MGRGWGLPAWLIGPMVYEWAYHDITNPFNEGAVPVDTGRADSLDYSRPVNVMAPPPDEALLRDGLARFHEARETFRHEDFMMALKLTDASLRLIPNDPALHQFRALTLMALHRYREAAATLDAVVAVVPGWDWTTLTHLYDHPETYTRQLRILETFAEANPRSAAARFLLACQYLTTGHDDAAIVQLRVVAALQPDNHLVAQLIQEFQPPRPTGTPGIAIADGMTGSLQGIWTSHPRKDTTITVTFRPRGHLTWEVNRAGKVRTYEGDFASDGTLTFSRRPGESMVGGVTWGGDRRFTFKVLEGQPADPGLSFAKSS
jgi:tetratricopeptide (TPR) repeat protein